MKNKITLTKIQERAEVLLLSLVFVLSTTALTG